MLERSETNRSYQRRDQTLSRESLRARWRQGRRLLASQMPLNAHVVDDISPRGDVPSSNRLVGDRNEASRKRAAELPLAGVGYTGPSGEFNRVRRDRLDPRDHAHVWTALQDCTERHRHSRAVASSPLDPSPPLGRARDSKALSREIS